MSAFILVGSAPKCYAVFPERFTKKAADTCINQDTVIITFPAMDGNILSFEYLVEKVNGTIPANSFAILQASVDGVRWDAIDTLTVLNQAINYKIYKVPRTYYYSYRLWYQTASGTQRSVLSFIYVRRPDED